MINTKLLCRQDGMLNPDWPHSQSLGKMTNHPFCSPQTGSETRAQAVAEAEVEVDDNADPSFFGLQELPTVNPLSSIHVEVSPC